MGAAPASSDDRSPRVLFIQTQVCSRTWKFAKGLADHGTPVDLLEISGSSPLVDYSVFANRTTFDYGKDMRSLVRDGASIQRQVRRVVRAGDYDVVHSHNTPDVVGIWAIRTARQPVVHDIHDLQTTIPVRWGSWLTRPVARALNRRWEKQVYQHADTIVVPTPAFIPYLRERYGEAEVVAIENKPAPIEVHPKPRLSARDGHIHVVYAGGLSTTPGSHRDYFSVFEELAGGDIHVHVYGVTFTGEEQERVRAFCERLSNVHYHRPVPATELIDELTQYDYGLLWFPLVTDNIRMSSPNKLWEYLLAGLPVIVNPDTRPAAIVAEHNAGFATETMQEARARLSSRPTFTIPTQGLTQDAAPLLECYRRLLQPR